MAADSRLSGFLDVSPTEVDNFRGIVLFGRNVASYKFALAKSLIELAQQGQQRVPLDELAIPFASHVSEHLARYPRQTTAASSTFLDACGKFNDGQITRDELTSTTVRLGFNNVIDAFHTVGGSEVSTRFFIDERHTSLGGITLTDEAHQLTETETFAPLAEIEARWRLVESAWDLGLDTSLIQVDDELAHLTSTDRRRQITSARDALNGYQKGSCFYCYRPVGVTPGQADLADIDHVFPHVLQRRGILTNLDGVWNLVLACVTCNRGPSGKFDAVPHSTYVERLAQRNDYLIASAHPLRETLRAQTGSDPASRRAYLQSTLNTAGHAMPSRWQTPAVGVPRF